MTKDWGQDCPLLGRYMLPRSSDKALGGTDQSKSAVFADAGTSASWQKAGGSLQKLPAIFPQNIRPTQ